MQYTKLLYDQLFMIISVEFVQSRRHIGAAWT